MNNVTWFVQEKISKWLSIFPQLEKRILEAKCFSCGKLLKAKRPFVSGNYVGIETVSCKCGANPIMVLAKRH